MNGHNINEKLTKLSYRNIPSSQPKFPTSGIFTSEPEAKTEITKTGQTPSNSDNTTVSPYDELSSFNIESPENEHSIIEYVTDNQFESCSDSELGTPTPSVRDPLSSEMLIARICESPNTGKLAVTKKMSEVSKYESKEQITKCNSTQNQIFNLQQQNSGQSDHVEEKYQNDIGANNMINKNEKVAEVSSGESKSKLTEVKINLSFQQQPQDTKKGFFPYQSKMNSNDNCINKENEPAISMPIMKCDESNIIFDSNVEEMSDQSEINIGESPLIKKSPSQHSTEDGSLINSNSNETICSSDVNVEKADKIDGNILSNISNENNIHTTDDTEHIINEPLYQTVQKQIYNYEKNINTSHDEVESVIVNENILNNNDCLRKNSETNTEKGHEININDENEVAQCENINTSNSKELFTESLDTLTSSVPIPPPRASSKYVIPPPVPPFVEEEEDRCTPPVPPLPTAFINRSGMNSPAIPQRQYLLVPIDQYNSKPIPQILINVPPSPPQRTVSYKKFAEMTPNHTTHHSPDSLKKS